MTLKALIFDVDGTLAETERDGHRVAFNQAFDDIGLSWHWSIARYGELLHVAGGKERIRAYIEQDQPPIPTHWDVEALIATLHQRKNQYYTDGLRRGEVQLRPGVRRLILEAQAQGIRLAIATTSQPENALALLETALAPDAPGWFEVIAAGDIVPHKKPAPDVYRYVLQQLGLPAHVCLAIEDTEQGLTAATGAGIPTVVTVNDYTREQSFAAAALVLTHLGEPQHLAQILAGSPLAGQPAMLTVDTARQVLQASVLANDVTVFHRAGSSSKSTASTDLKPVI